MTQTNCIVVIYDNTGKIWYQGSGLGTPDGLQYMELQLDPGDYVESMDVTTTPHTPIVHKGMVTMEELKTQIEDLTLAMAELLGV